jgi:hypothetical protein
MITGEKTRRRKKCMKKITKMIMNEIEKRRCRNMVILRKKGKNEKKRDEHDDDIKSKVYFI